MLITVILVLGLCLHHFSMTGKLAHATVHDKTSVRQAAEYSIAASNTVNPILALTEITKAVQLMESLHGRYGAELASSLCSVDTEHMMTILLDQYTRILQDVMAQCPGFLSPHPLNQHAKMIPTYYRQECSDTEATEDIDTPDTPNTPNTPNTPDIPDTGKHVDRVRHRARESRQKNKHRNRHKQYITDDRDQEQKHSNEA